MNSAPGHAETHMSVLWCQHRLAMPVVWWHLVVHRLVHSDHHKWHLVRLNSPFRVIGRRVVFGHGVSASGEAIAMIWFQSITAPVTEEIIFGHFHGMFLRDIASQIVQLQTGQTGLRPFIIYQT